MRMNTSTNLVNPTRGDRIVSKHGTQIKVPHNIVLALSTKPHAAGQIWGALGLLASATACAALLSLLQSLLG